MRRVKKYQGVKKYQVSMVIEFARAKYRFTVEDHFTLSQDRYLVLSDALNRIPGLECYIFWEETTTSTQRGVMGPPVRLRRLAEDVSEVEP